MGNPVLILRASILQWPSLDFIQCLARDAKHFSRPDGEILLLPALKCNPNVQFQPPTMLSALEYKKTWSLLYKNHSWMKWQNHAALNIKALKWTHFSLLDFVLQEIFLQLIKKLNRIYHSFSRLLGWLFQVWSEDKWSKKNSVSKHKRNCQNIRGFMSSRGSPASPYPCSQNRPRQRVCSFWISTGASYHGCTAHICS